MSNNTDYICAPNKLDHKQGALAWVNPDKQQAFQQHYGRLLPLNDAFRIVASGEETSILLYRNKRYEINDEYLLAYNSEFKP